MKINILSRIYIFFIRSYKKLLSPYLGQNCRFYPTCSDYSIQAVRKKGLIVGLILSIYRILRCNQFSKGGFDPVE
ncbi:MAG: membrane protein insertion efficiency factor YidD [Candidatus Muiribacterium halophilum]|uniref:Putative membrane protein insertion efficiency factor n=1 Tax=Muiribacterium halophilum TaxID=2053465 RepID=A0A2N5ZDW7_MUIH1|nr:MAG: membrane protein insertion efficiency factor YidD [Candidatus Muirbacterium halophilum]